MRNELHSAHPQIDGGIWPSVEFSDRAFARLRPESKTTAQSRARTEGVPGPYRSNFWEVNSGLPANRKLGFLPIVGGFNIPVTP